MSVGYFVTATRKVTKTMMKWDLSQDEEWFNICESEIYYITLMEARKKVMIFSSDKDKAIYH